MRKLIMKKAQSFIEFSLVFALAVIVAIAGFTIFNNIKTNIVHNSDVIPRNAK